jgi:hypothetical protein
MTLTWHLLKYLPDLRRGEPVNVGVVLQHEDAFITRFRDIDDGKVTRSARSWCSEPRNYEQWVKYLQFHIAEFGNLAIEPRPGDSYRLLPSGEVDQNSIDPEGFIVELYNMLVAPRAPHRRARGGFEAQVEDLFRRSRLVESEHFHKRFTVENSFGQKREFQYAWSNGHVTVGSRLNSAKANAIDTALWRLAALPESYGSVLLLGDVDQSEIGLREELDRSVSFVVSVDEVSPDDLYGMFAEVPRERVRT